MEIDSLVRFGYVFKGRICMLFDTQLFSSKTELQRHTILWRVGTEWDWLLMANLCCVQISILVESNFAIARSSITISNIGQQLKSLSRP
jgi:hypothetical protein